MTPNELVKKRVHEYYWHEDLNCAICSLKILSECFKISLQAQTLDAAIGLHGAGRFGAQCGLVEGPLMFLGIYGKQQKIPENDIVESCYRFAEAFQARFGTLLCRELRPAGFKPDSPPHLCTPLSEDAIIFALEYLFRTWP